MSGINIEQFKEELSKVSDTYFADYRAHHEKAPEEWPVADRELSDWFEDFLCHLQTKGIIL